MTELKFQSLVNICMTTFVFESEPGMITAHSYLSQTRAFRVFERPLGFHVHG